MTTTAEHPQRVGRLVPLLLSGLGTALLGLQATLSFIQPARPGGAGGTGAVTAGLTVAATMLALAATVVIGRAAALAMPLSVTALAAAAVLQMLGPAPPRFIALVPLALATALLALPLAPTDGRSSRSTLWATLALALHAAVAFPYLTSGLVAPPYGVFALWIIWGAFLALILRLLRTRAPLALLVPPVALATWFAALSLGEVLLGWSP